jgi:hypothetical protein
MPRNRNTPDPKVDAFLEKAINYEGDDCLIWPFGVNPNGSAKLNRLGRTYGSNIVSRAVCEEAHGPPPTPEHEAAHSISCISRRCVNQRHLRWATRGENANDIILRDGVYANAKLSQEDVLEIRRIAKTLPSKKRLDNLRIRKEIAFKFDLTLAHVNRIVNGFGWEWLEEPCDEELIFYTTRPKMKDLFV